ncbi:MAG: hypothetical protein OEW99_04585 [Gammaproteobacteria bacterium]|nr:hypothetical protein [Gammaproteobacteria bacterium]MDH5660498.1 hypothetical protein [Gammaproteobacteria bacterium]
MKKIIVISVLFLFVFFFMVNKKTGNNEPIVETYPWQVTILPDGRSRVFGIVFGETTLKEVDDILNSRPTIALFEENEKLSLEAYYKNVSLGGMIGSFIITLNASIPQLNNIKKKSAKQKRAENNGKRYELDKLASDESKKIAVKNLIYIPTVQLDEEIIVKRFGKPTHKIKLKTKEIGWHYLYPEKGLDLIYKEEGKEVLQYVLPKNFNYLLEPLQSH